MLDLIEMRWNCGVIEYRQRVCYRIYEGDDLDVPTDKLHVTGDWSSWKKIDAVKGDASDARFE